MELSWLFNGEKVDIDLLDVLGTEWRDAKRWTGMAAGPLQTAAVNDSDFEATAALIAIAMRRIDPAVQYEEVLAVLSFRVLATVSG
jgi:hypothetical protein